MLRLKNFFSQVPIKNRYFRATRKLDDSQNSCEYWEKPVLDTYTSDYDKYWDKQGQIIDSPARFLLCITPADFQDGSLTNIGRMQCGMTGSNFRDLRYPIQKIVHTLSPKTYQTAQLIREHALQSRLQMSHCIICAEAEKLDDQLASRKDQADLLFRNEPLVEAAFRKIFYRAMPGDLNYFEIYVLPANLISYFACRACQLSPHAWSRFSAPQCSVTAFVIDDHSTTLDSFGDTGHFPQKKYISTEDAWL